MSDVEQVAASLHPDLRRCVTGDRTSERQGANGSVCDACLQKAAVILRERTSTGEGTPVAWEHIYKNRVTGARQRAVWLTPNVKTDSYTIEVNPLVRADLRHQPTDEGREG